MALLKQSTIYTRMFLLVGSSDHITGLTGATATVNISKAGGTFAAAGGTVTEVANGWYKVALTTTDTNTLGELAFHITATSADSTDFVDQVVVDIPGGSVSSVTGNVSGSVASVTGAVGSVTGNVGGNVTGSVGSVLTGGLVDLTSTTYAESSAVPAATATLKDKIVWLATLARNKITQTSTTQTLRNDGDTGNISTSTDSDDGTTYTRGKWA